MTLNNALVLIIGVVAIIWYYICLIGIGIHPLPLGTPADGFRQFMSLSLTSLGASMATFIGMLLGIRSISGTVRTEVAAANTDTPNLKQLAAGAFTTISGQHRNAVVAFNIANNTLNAFNPNLTNTNGYAFTI